MARYVLQTPVEHEERGRGYTRTYMVQLVQRKGGSRAIEQIHVDWDDGTSTWHEPGTLRFLDPPAIRAFIERLETFN